MKTRYCDECEHAQFSIYRLDMVCTAGHKPRFYIPKSPNPADTNRESDTNWGWKRGCEDYEDAD
jgi:hypothetical protein